MSFITDYVNTVYTNRTEHNAPYNCNYHFNNHSILNRKRKIYHK